MPDIQIFTKSVRDFSQSVDFWNQLMLWGLAIAALATVFVVIATRIVVLRSGQLSVAQDRLSEAKDRQLASDLKEKDEKIADALKAAGEANLRAEHEKLERIKLEEDLSPRSFSNAAEATKRLSSFRGTSVVLEYSLDLECKATAERIAFVLSEAGWTIRPHPNNDPNAVFFEGIVVGYVGKDGVGVNPVPIAVRLPFDKTPPTKTAGEILLDELNSSGMDAHSVPGIGIISEAVYVYVGFRPSPESKRALKIKRGIERRTTESFGTSKCACPLG
jgi:hypothetical protein